MATTISPSDQAADLPKNLSIDQETMAKVPANTANNNKDVYGGNSNSGFSNKSGLLPNKGLNQKKLGYNNYSSQKGYYGSYPTGGYYPQAYQYPRYGYDMNYASGKTTTNTPSSYLGRSGSGYMDSVYSMYGPYMSGYGYDSYGGYSTYTPNWYAFDNGYKTKGYGFYGYGKENAEWLNELNRGPRAKGFKIGQPETLKAAPVDASVPDSKEYNKEDFSDAYTNAKLFVIKSYSEDDIHKSIKYNVWSSTPNGNKKLNAAYNEAVGDKSSCPVFLIFSVNTSGQFVGLAEMVGPVDFNQTVEYWQQDKWVGCFPVKWHIVKDIPNSSLRHITLENNENKPVTNSRDTQEVKIEQGVKVIKIFKEHETKTSILDDFVFYESREKIIKEGKKKHQLYKKQQALAASDKKVTPKDEAKETKETTSMIPEVVEEISQNGVAEVASAC
ncbi:YTH domain-containing protein ECT3 [Raphanus sativus]|uniref:YTH domain-containing family protein n=1 Tax=Raphanus sativus TaxID=3726 RepID=A0A6J0KCE8_RAPSA|nr:YTH domain-containing protein ECT3 [Raphanus sativus]